jgi:hypothetical protein
VAQTKRPQGRLFEAGGLLEALLAGLLADIPPEAARLWHEALRRGGHAKTPPPRPRRKPARGE